MSVESVVSMNLCPTALIPTKTFDPKSSSSGTAQRLHYVPPQPYRIVVLLVEEDPGEGHLGFFYLTPVGQERRLPVAGRGAYDADFAVQGVPEELEQSATDQLLGSRRRRPQLGLENDPGRINAWVARGVNYALL